MLPPDNAGSINGSPVDRAHEQVKALHSHLLEATNAMRRLRIYRPDYASDESFAAAMRQYNADRAELDAIKGRAMAMLLVWSGAS